MTEEQLVTRSIFHALRERLVVEGWLPDIVPLDIDNPTDTPAQTEAKVTQFRNQMKAIKASKGFVIELFDYGSNQAKGAKEVPRIVLHNSSLLPSAEIANDPATRYEKKDDYFIRVQDELVPSDLITRVYAIGNTSAQMFIMNQVIINSLPKKGYIKRYTDNLPLFSGNYFIKQTDRGETEGLPEGTLERYYVYETKDLQETGSIILDGQIPRIDDINLETVIE